jgi:hypothetical protein
MFALMMRMLRLDKVLEINARFRFGRLAAKPGNRIILFFLKIYLVALFGLLAFKFYQIMRGGQL